jgi:hypothetical protein
MHDKLLETCSCEFERGVKRLFETAKKLSPTLRETPVIGGVFIADMDYAPFLLQVCRALVAREQFRLDAPGWPTLPLRSEDCDALEDDDNPRIKVLGYYAGSVRHARWQAHPPFTAFVSGLLAYAHTPDCVRSNRELQREFPPRRLEGLCDGELYWRDPEEIALDRENLRRIAVMEAREANV